MTPLFALSLILTTGLFSASYSTVASADYVINGCTVVSNPTPTNFTDCPDANLSHINFGFNLSYANLQDADLSYSNAFQANFTDANLSGANLTFLYNSDSNMTGDLFVEYGYATSPAGAYVNVTSYNHEFGIPGATFNGCTFSSGIFPIGTTYGQCSITDSYGGIATDPGSQVIVYKTGADLTAQPALLSTSPTPTLYAFTMTATLTFAPYGGPPPGPIVGQPVTFTAGSSSCTGTTGGSGIATCNVLLDPIALASVIAGDGYEATYAGNSWIYPNSAINPGLVYAPPYVTCGPPLSGTCPPPP